MHTNHISRTALLFLLATAVACQGSVVSTPERLPGVAPAVTAAPSDAVHVYFTDPSNPRSDTLRGGPDQALADAIDNAQAGVDMAVLQINLWSLRDALLRAHRRGVKVRVVIDSDYRDEDEVQDLLDAGVPLLGDRREGLMHNKFTIIDRQEVWTGSMNYSITDGYRNNNNLIRIRSAELAENYTAEFEEMFVDDRFGPGSPANTPHPQLSVNGVPVQVCFSPDDGCTEKLTAQLENARSSVHFMAYSFTSDPLTEALLDLIDRGVEVAGVMEASQARSNAGADYTRLQQAGVDVRLDGNPRNMHHKVIIIDGRIVVAGSFNFTYYAETRNDENMLVIEDPALAAQYEAEFQRMMSEAQ